MLEEDLMSMLSKPFLLMWWDLAACLQVRAQLV